MAQQAGLTLSVQSILGQRQGVALQADRDPIVQILTNLLSNAIKFSPAGTRVCLTGFVREQLQAAGVTISPIAAYGWTQSQTVNILIRVLGERVRASCGFCRSCR